MTDNIKKRFLINSIISILLVIGIYWQCNNSQGYYYWLCNNLLITNFEYMSGSGSHLNHDQKSEIKIGKTYNFLKLIKESTPENAIILFPPSQVFFNKSNQVEFNGYIDRKGYVSYFLYPRQVVYENEKDQNKLYQKVSHIAIVNYWGYDKLNYPIPEKIPYSVLSVHAQSTNENSG